MYIPKRYGHSKIQDCPFCGKSATTENSQGVPVCQGHKNDRLDDLRCFCGEPLDIMKGKFGPYFRCMNCGNINFRKGLEMNTIAPKPANKTSQVNNKKQSTSEKHTQTEITITSEDVEYF